MLEPRPLDLETNTLTIRPPRLTGSLLVSEQKKKLTSDNAQFVRYLPITTTLILSVLSLRLFSCDILTV